MEHRIEELPLVKGGQGREAEDVKDSALNTLLTVVIVAGILATAALLRWQGLL